MYVSNSLNPVVRHLVRRNTGQRSPSPGESSIRIQIAQSDASSAPLPTLDPDWALNLDVSPN